MRLTFLPQVRAVGLLSLLLSCSQPTTVEGQSPAPPPPAQVDVAIPSVTVPSVAVAPVGATPKATNDSALPLPVLPPTLNLERPIELPIADDRPLRIRHAGPQTAHAIVYLHGMCGDSKGADPWSDLATQYGTLIVVRADEPCLDRPGYKWPKDLTAIQARIDRALRTVKDLRNGVLDAEHPTLIGYSQGAYRAEQLIGQFPGRYLRAILGGPPTPPSYEALKSAVAVAVLGGELENHQHMLDGTTDLIAHGLHAHFFLLPRVHHGSYGPEGRRILAQALTFVFDGQRP